MLVGVEKHTLNTKEKKLNKNFSIRKNITCQQVNYTFEDKQLWKNPLQEIYTYQRRSDGGGGKLRVIVPSTQVT